MPLNSLNSNYKDFFNVPTHLLVQSILELSNAFPQNRESRYRPLLTKPTDLKIKTFVLQQIVQAIKRKTGALFPSATAPRVVIDVLSSLNLPKTKREERIQLIPSKPRPARPSLRSASSNRIPIGLSRCNSCNWINSLIQFLMFLPGSWELFSLVPRSFQPLREFADQYFSDQQDNHPVSSADSRELVRCLMRKIPTHFLQQKPILYEILLGWIKGIFPHCPFDIKGEIHPVILHPEWHVVSNFYDFEEAFQKKINERPPELLVAFKGTSFPLKRHYFAQSEGVSYDLDSFIELRPDGENGENYIAYLKRNGTWYQCDDDRVVQFRSNCLNLPLRGATLLHYKRIELTSRNYTKYQK